MVNYALGKIYKVEFEGNLYIGSTSEKYLSNRRCKHVDLSKHNRIMPLYVAINARESKWNAVHLILVETYPCNSLDELRAREQYWIDQLKPNLNVSSPYVSEEEQKERKRLDVLQYLESKKNDPEFIARQRAAKKRVE
jgi:hypothetical protein